MKGSGHKLKEGNWNIMKSFFPTKRIKQWHRLPREVGCSISLIFSIPEWTSPGQLGLNSHLICLSRRLDQRPPEASSRLNYLVVLWFCDVSLHMQTLETIWNSSNIKHLKTQTNTSIPHIMCRLVWQPLQGILGLVSLPNMAVALRRYIT